MNMKYQLVLQLPASSDIDFDSLVLIEDKLSESMGEKHIVDGHDFGSGEMNIFIHTDDPDAAFDLAKHNVSPGLKPCDIRLKQVNGKQLFFWTGQVLVCPHVGPSLS